MLPLGAAVAAASYAPLVAAVLPTCVRPLPGTFGEAAAQKQSLRCFAAYAGWAGFGDKVECASDVGLLFPDDFAARWAGSGETALESLPGLRGAFASGNDIEAFANPLGKTGSTIPAGLDQDSSKYNASLAIPGGRQPDSAAFFETLEDLKSHCGSPDGLPVLQDLLLAAASHFYLKDLPKEAWSAWAPDEGQLRRLWFCAHNSRFTGDWGVQASVPYLHLHATDQAGYPEFRPLAGIPAAQTCGPGNFTRPESWERHGGACMALDGAEDGRPMKELLGEVAQKLWDIIPSAGLQRERAAQRRGPNRERLRGILAAGDGGASSLGAYAPEGARLVRRGGGQNV